NDQQRHRVSLSDARPRHLGRDRAARQNSRPEEARGELGKYSQGRRFFLFCRRRAAIRKAAVRYGIDAEFVAVVGGKQFFPGRYRLCPVYFVPARSPASVSLGQTTPYRRMVRKGRRAAGLQ